MSKLVWDAVGKREYETGVDHGVLYPHSGAGVAWNGLTAVNEAPSGAESTALYADNIKYVNLRSAEDFGGTIECYTYPPEWKACDGSTDVGKGITIGQQKREPFGLSYRTKIGNDTDGEDAGYKLHLVYGCTASPSEKNYQTVNDSPEAITFSYEFETTPVPVTGYKPTSILTINSIDADPDKLAEIEKILYGDDLEEPRLPLPDEVIEIISGE